MEFVAAGLVGAAFGVSRAYAGVPRLKPLLVLSQMVILLAMIGFVVADVTTVTFPVVITALVATCVVESLVEGYLWSRESMPMTGRYWWWVGQTLLPFNDLERIHKAHAAELAESARTTPSPHDEPGKES